MKRILAICAVAALAGCASGSGDADISDVFVLSPPEKVLFWLKEQQCEDGSWRDGSNPVASTALAMMAFLEHGELPSSGSRFSSDYLDHPVALASDYLVDFVRKSSALQGHEAQWDETALPVVALALVEVYDLTKNPDLKEPAIECVRRVVERNRNVPVEARTLRDMDSVAWSARALRMAKMGNVCVDGLVECYDGLTNYLGQCGCDENSYYSGLRKYRAAMRRGSTAEDRAAWMDWNIATRRNCRMAFVDESPGAKTFGRGFYKFPASSPNASGLGVTADSALVVLKFMIGGGGMRTLPTIGSLDLDSDCGDSSDTGVVVDI